MAIFARLERKTTRNFPPLPRTLNSPRLRSKLRLSAQSSEMRRPVENNISKIALSRSERKSKSLGAAKSRSRSEYSIISICLVGILGSSIFSGDKTSISRLFMYFKKFLKAIT